MILAIASQGLQVTNSETQCPCKSLLKLGGALT